MIPPFIFNILLEVSPFPPTYSFQSVPMMKWKLAIVLNEFVLLLEGRHLVDFFCI